MAIFPGDRTCAGHVSGAVEIRRQHFGVPIRAGKTVIVTGLPRLEPRSFPALFALHRAGTDLVGEPLERWRSLFQAHSPTPIGPRRWFFFMQRPPSHQRLSARDVAECRGFGGAYQAT